MQETDCEFVESTEYGNFCAYYMTECDPNECKILEYGLGQKDLRPGLPWECLGCPFN